MSYYLAPYRIRSVVYSKLDKYRMHRMISDVRQGMIQDASALIRLKKIHNPDLYLLEKSEPSPLGGQDIVMAYFIGTGLELTPILRDEGWEVFEQLKVSTSEKGWVKRFKDFINEKTTGEKPDPHSLNPYS